MAEAALHLYDPETGEVVELDEGADNALLERLNISQQDVVNLQRQNTKLLRRIKTLEDDKERQRAEAAERAEVEDIFREWQEVAGKHRSKLSADRFDAIHARLKDGYSRKQFSLSIAGGCFDPFVTEAKNGRMMIHNDIELICRDGKRFESAALKAPKDAL